MSESENNSQYLAGLVGASIILLIIAIVLLIVLINKNNDSALNENRATESTKSDEAEALPEDTSTYKSPAATTPKPEPKPKGSCRDVTSYDYNWDNDMLCTRPNGSTFYTDYAGAEAYENSQ